MRLGLFGGTFNPIHVGHLLLAESARQQYALDQVLFIPTANPPHKSSRDLLSGAARLALIRLAIRGNPAFRASDLELRLGGISYSLRTVQEVARRHPRASLFFIVGQDMLQVRWRGWPQLTALCTFLVAGRPQTGASSRRRGVRRIEMPAVDISSSMIRTRAARGQSLRYLVPEAVERAIVRQRLYRTR